MARHDDDNAGMTTGEFGLLIAIWAAETALHNAATTLGRLARVLRRNRRGPVQSPSGVRGTPCAADFAWTGDDDEVVTRPALTHAARIPPEVVERIDKGGE